MGPPFFYYQCLFVITKVCFVCIPRGDLHLFVSDANIKTLFD